MFSDGITEARDPGGEEFGEDRLIQVPTALGLRPVAELVTGILQSVRRFCKGSPQADDMTVFAVRYISAPEPH